MLSGPAVLRQLLCTPSPPFRRTAHLFSVPLDRVVTSTAWLFELLLVLLPPLPPLLLEVLPPLVTAAAGTTPAGAQGRLVVVLPAHGDQRETPEAGEISSTFPAPTFSPGAAIFAFFFTFFFKWRAPLP